MKAGKSPAGIARYMLAPAFFAASLAFGGSASSGVAYAQDATPVTGAPEAPLEVALHDADDTEVGTATFTQGNEGVTLSIEVTGLPPGEHGWHLHAMGECDPSGLEPFASAGGHWNPTGMMHGAPDAENHHAGDFGNLTAGDDGAATAEITTADYTLLDGSDSVFDEDGTAIIIHEGVDDLVSQPAGNSGARYACGVVAGPTTELEMAPPAGAPTPEASVQGNLLTPAQVPFSDDLLAGLQAPDGFEISVYAQGLTNPRMMAVGPDGTVYVTENEANTVRALRDTDGDNVIDEAQPVATNLEGVHGIAIHEGQVFLAGTKQIWVTDLADDGTFGDTTVLMENLPDGGQHGRRTIAYGPDDKLYISIGSDCNACRPTNPETATIIRANPDGSEREVFAKGLRNTLGWSWEPESGALFGFDQGSDWRGDDQPPEELNMIEEGSNYGWPFCYADKRVDIFLSQPPSGATPEQYCANTVAPALTYQAHSSPIGMAFYSADQFPAEYQGDAFVAMRGSWNRGEPTGYKIVRVNFDGGQPVAIDDFVTGWLIDNGASQFGRVAGVTVAADGSLLVADDTNGVIYRIAYTG